MNALKGTGFALILAMALAGCGETDGNNDNSTTANNTANNGGLDVPQTVVSSGSFTDVADTPPATGAISVREDDDGTLYVYLGADFMQGEGPGDTELRLAKGDGNAGEQLEADSSSVSEPIATIANGASGEMLLEIPGSVNVADFSYAIIWCPTAGVNFGVAEIGDAGTDLASWSGTIEPVADSPMASGGVTIEEQANGEFKITLGADFMQGEGPGDTEVRLAMGSDNAAAQLESDPNSVSDAIGTVANGASGTQEFTISMDPSSYTHLIIWCPTAGINFGVAELAAN